MQVSVVLPARNAAPWIETAIASIQRQTFSNLELIVVDDHSVDNTRDLLISSAVADSRIRLISSRGRGLVAALNTGIAEARAPLIARMDADDIARPNRLEIQTAFLERHPSVAVVGAQVQPVDLAGQPSGKTTNYPTEPEDISRELVQRGCVISHPTVLMRRAALDAAGGYRAVTEMAEDYDLWLRIAEHNAIANLPEVLLDYRMHPDQISHGLNWSQRFARDLAVISARARRQGEKDPLEDITAPIQFQDQSNSADSNLPLEVQQLISGYIAACAAFLSADDVHDLDAIETVARNGLFGDGRKVRGQLMALAARAAWRRRSPARAFQNLAASVDLMGPGAIKVALKGRTQWQSAGNVPQLSVNSGVDVRQS
ncbi:MAG: glycosyltransferase family 2 protein [Pseudorhodoplanes sp.]